MQNSKELYPFFERILPQSEKEKLLNQRSKVIWLTGLSGSGKTTTALGLEKKLHQNGYLCKILDGDNIRTGINNNLSFTKEDRIENIRRIAEVSLLFLRCGVITINAFVSPTNEIRGIARKIIGNDNFIEVFVDTPLEICEKRDVKGLYKKAREGIIKNFTGISAPFEIPENTDLIIKTANKQIDETISEVYNFILPKIEYYTLNGTIIQ